jgi:hypothetical protein
MESNYIKSRDEFEAQVDKLLINAAIYLLVKKDKQTLEYAKSVVRTEQDAKKVIEAHTR